MRIKATKVFEKSVRKTMTREALEALYDYLAVHPDAGEIVPGTGGVRKLRWRTGKGGGKRGGVRIIYYYDQDVLVILITMYTKSDKENLTAGEKNEIKSLLPSLIEQMQE